MPVFATDTYKLSHVLKHEYEPASAYCREALVCNEAAAKTYAIGTVLGKVTATGKWKISVQNAVDGSQNPAAVVMEDKSVPITTDTRVLALVRGPSMVSKTALVLDASFDLQAEKDALYAALEAKGILVVDAI
jgi:hypothetical protein